MAKDEFDETNRDDHNGKKENNIQGETSVKKTDNHREEFSAESMEYGPRISDPSTIRGVRENRANRDVVDRVDRDNVGGRGLGIFALVISILSLFMFPFLFGVGSIIIGFIARRQGAAALGGWAIAIGIASLILQYVFRPIF